MKSCGAASLLSAVAALLALPCQSFGSALSTLVADEGGAEQTDESLEELTAERDDLKAQLATKNQEFLAQHSRADRLAARVSALKRQLAAEAEKTRGLELRLSQVRSLVDADAEVIPAVASSAPQSGNSAATQVIPAVASSAPQSGNSTATPQTSAAAAPAGAAAAPPPAPQAEGAAEQASRGKAAGPLLAEQARGEAAPLAAGPPPAARAAGSESAPARAKAPLARPSAAGGPAAERPARHAPRPDQRPAPAATRGPRRPRPRPARAELESRARPPGGPAAAGPRPTAGSLRRSRAVLMSELKEQVSQLAPGGGQAAPAAAAAADQGRPAGGGRPEVPAQPTEQSSTNATGGADFDELETQLHDEDRKIDELDRESQDDASFAENGSLQGDAAGSALKVDLNPVPVQVDALGDNSSLATGSDSADDSLFFAQLSKI